MRTIVGLLMLLRILIRSRFRLRGAYWAWRTATAMGGQRLGSAEIARMGRHYLRWMAQMRRIAR